MGARGGWVGVLLVVAVLPLGARGGAGGRGAFPLVVGWVGGNDFPR